MKLFVSWSKPLSNQYAICFRDWIGKVFQSVDPFMSDQDIDLGSKGIPAIEEQLNKIDFGLIFVTKENMEAPWIHYEAGALSRAVELPESRVIPILINMGIADLGASPLSNFQGCLASKDGIQRVCQSINATLPRGLTESALLETFETWWPKLDACWSSIEMPDQLAEDDVTLETLDKRLQELTKMVASFRGSERETYTNALRAILESQRSTTQSFEPVYFLDSDGNPTTNALRAHYFNTEVLKKARTVKPQQASEDQAGDD